MEYYIAIKRNTALVPTMPWVNLEHIMMTEANHKRPHIIQFHLYKCLEQGNLYTQRAGSWLLGGGEGGGGHSYGVPCVHVCLLQVFLFIRPSDKFPQDWRQPSGGSRAGLLMLRASSAHVLGRPKQGEIGSSSEWPTAQGGS